MIPFRHEMHRIKTMLLNKKNISWGVNTFYFENSFKFFMELEIEIRNSKKKQETRSRNKKLEIEIRN